VTMSADCLLLYLRIDTLAAWSGAISRADTSSWTVRTGWGGGENEASSEIYIATKCGYKCELVVLIPSRA
jgi:hypothetical protein